MGEAVIVPLPLPLQPGEPFEPAGGRFLLSQPVAVAVAQVCSLGDGCAGVFALGRAAVPCGRFPDVTVLCGGFPETLTRMAPPTMPLMRMNVMPASTSGLAFSHDHALPSPAMGVCHMRCTNLRLSHF